MWRCIALCLCLSTCTELGQVRADDKADELARLTGEYTAESYVRTGQQPAKKEVLKALTLEVRQDRWVQKFRGESAPYAITLDLAKNPKAIQLTHQKVQAVRDCKYVLKEDTLTVIEQVGEKGDNVVTVWKRKPMLVD